MKNSTSILIKISYIILFFAGVFLFFNIVFFLMNINAESFSKKYISFIKKNNNELNAFFHDLDSIKEHTDAFYIQYHLNLNELYLEDSNEQNSLFFEKNENRIKELFSKYDILNIKYVSDNKGTINVEFQKTTRFGTIQNDLGMSFKIDDNNHICYYFIKENDTVNITTIPLKKD